MEKKYLIFTLACLLLSSSIHAQVTIGSLQKPLSGALLDLKQEGTTTKGLMLPRVKLDDLSKLKMGTNEILDTDHGGNQYAMHTGLWVYNITGSATPQCEPIPDGVYVWGGTNWQGIGVDIRTIPTAPTVVGDSRCGSGTVTLSGTCTGALHWYDTPTGGACIYIGDSYSPTVNSDKTYYVEAFDGVCPSARVAVTATVESTPTVSSTNTSRCGSGSVTFSASGGTTMRWYVDSSTSTVLHTGANYPTSIGSSTTLYVEASNGSCTSARKAVTISVYSQPSMPTASSITRCGSGIETLSATGSGTIKWYNYSGGWLYTGSNFTTPTLTSTTKYYVEASNGSCTSGRRLVTVTVNSAPSAPATTSNSRCGTGEITLTASGTDLKWYTSNISSSPIATGTTYKPTVTNPTTTFYVESNNGSCSSTRTSVTATVNAVPSAPTTTGNSRCGSGEITLTASGTVLKWYTSSTGGSPIASGNTYKPTVGVGTTTYYVESNNSLCPSATRTAVTAVASSVPSAPTTTGASRCGTGEITLTASGTDMKWYTSSTGGSPIATGSTYKPTVTNPTTTFYVESNNGICSSATRTSVTATVNAVPTIPGSLGGSRCGTGPVEVIVQASGSPTYYWYTTKTGGSHIATGSSYTPTVSITTTFYAEVYDGKCRSLRIPVTATVTTITPPYSVKVTLRSGSDYDVSWTRDGTGGQGTTKIYYLDTNGKITANIPISLHGGPHGGGWTVGLSSSFGGVAITFQPDGSKCVSAYGYGYMKK